jgi:carbon starvation protein
MVLNTPAFIVGVGLVVFAVTYVFYSRWVDKKIWKSDPARPTPAHMYTDGVEYFPVGRFVLYGFQFNSIAALGPILGPGIAIFYGWLPALLWILFANLFIGWAQDYSAMFLSVRNEGKSFGPLAHEMLGPRPRKLLLGYLMFYFILINAAFIFVVGNVLNEYPGVFWTLLGLTLTSLVVGHLIFNVRMNIAAASALAIVMLVVSVLVGTFFTWPPKNALGIAPYTLWLIPLVIILMLGGLLPLPKLVTPMNYITYYPVIVAILLLIVASLLSPFTGVVFEQPAVSRATANFEWVAGVGPVWPILFVAIACGAVSGWHSLISSGITSRQLDVETDARPVGAGAMLTEGLVSLTALAAFVVLATAPGAGTPANFVGGAVELTSAIFPAGFGGALTTFFGIYMVFMAVTILTILGRYWRVVSAEIFGGTSFAALGNKYVASVLGWAFPIAFVLTGSWVNIWLYFGGTNQLLAGFALTLVGIYLISRRTFHWYTFVPGIFMMVTTLAAIAVQVYIFFDLVSRGASLPQQKPLVDLAGPGAAVAVNLFSVIIGVAMLLIGIALFGYLLRSAVKARATAAVPAAANGGQKEH